MGHRRVRRVGHVRPDSEFFFWYLTGQPFSTCCSTKKRSSTFFHELSGQMGGVVCRSASPQASPRDTEAMRRSLFGESFQGRECDCDALFCLACEYRGQFLESRTQSENSSTSENNETSRHENKASDLGGDPFLEIKQKFRSSSGKTNSLVKYRSQDVKSSFLPCLAVSCPEFSTIRLETGITKLKNLKPLPPKHISYRVFSMLEPIDLDDARPKECPP